MCESARDRKLTCARRHPADPYPESALAVWEIRGDGAISERTVARHGGAEDTEGVKNGRFDGAGAQSARAIEAIGTYEPG